MANPVLGTTSSPAFSLASGGVSVDLDMTFVMQMVLFLGLIIALKPLLFDPLMRVFEERERRTEGAREEARKMQEKAGELLVRYEAELRRVNEIATEERDRIRTETARLETQILAEAREATSRIIDHGRAQIEEQADKIQFELGRQSERLAKELASRALGREIH